MSWLKPNQEEKIIKNINQEITVEAMNIPIDGDTKVITLVNNNYSVKQQNIF